MKYNRLLPSAACGAAILFALFAVIGTVQSVLSQPSKPPASKSAAKGGGAIDIDLTRMSGPMVYSQVYELVTNPLRYRGKTIRMSGTYATFTSDETGKRYHACLISDAMACCQQGLEFAATNAVSYPKDFPKPGYPITVQGEFATYKEYGRRFAVITNAVILFAK